jgi:type IV pilus assembly protein PilF
MSKFYRITVASAVLMLAACARQPTIPSPTTPPAPAAPQPADTSTRADIHTQLGAAYYGIGNFAVALQSLNEALRAEPDFAPAHNVLGLVYMELKEDEKAEQSFRRALSINPQDSDANNNYGWFLCLHKRYDEGLKHFAVALKNPLYQTPEKSYVNAGMCERDRGDNKAAAEFFDRALKVQPVQPQALFQLAEIAFQGNDYTQARTYLDRLGRSGSAMTAGALWLAVRVERRLGDKDAEASYGLQLRRNYPNSREAQALLNRQFE